MTVFAEISIIIVIATAIAGLMRLLRQPLIIGHIITGLIVGPYFFNVIQTEEIISVFSEIGIALLLFTVGLGLSPRLIKEVGKIALITGLGQVIFTSLIGFLICQLFGFSFVASIYTSIALAFSSTIIIVKLLSDKKDSQKLYGKIALGFLLIQDIIATFILIIVSALSNGGDITKIVSAIAIQGFALIILCVLVSVYILPRLSYFFAHSQEFLFLFSISWGLGLATLFYYFGFSIEIGALIAGVTLSISPYHTEISSKMKPLRDFFIILFFILLGSKMAFDNIYVLILPTIIFSLFVLIGNPLIVMILMRQLGYNKRTGFLAGLTVAQISEFSLILIMLGVKLGHVEGDILSLVTLVGLITIAGSTYLILYAEKIYTHIYPLLSIFEKNNTKDKKTITEKYDIILFGHNRIGYDFIKSFNKLKKKFLVIDFDPQIIKYLTEKNIPHRYGDADDVEFLCELNLEKIKMAVSTIPDFKTNSLIIRKIREKNSKAIIVAISHNIKEAERLYERGASYVILPHFLGGKYASNMIRKFSFNKIEYTKERKKHISYLEQRKKIGHEHPTHVGDR